MGSELRPKWFGREIIRLCMKRSLKEEGEVSFSDWNWKNLERIGIMAKKRPFWYDTILPDRSEVL